MSTKKQPRLLTNEELQVIQKTRTACSGLFCRYDVKWWHEYNTYLDEAIRQNQTKELITHQDDRWVNSIMNFREGADTVMGTLGEYIAHLCLLMNGADVTPHYDENSQMSEKDLFFTYDGEDANWGSVKLNAVRENGKIRLGYDYFREISLDVDRLLFVDVYACTTRSFDVDPLADYFLMHRNKSRPNGFIYVLPDTLPVHEVMKVKDE